MVVELVVVGSPGVGYGCAIHPGEALPWPLLLPVQKLLEPRQSV